MRAFIALPLPGHITSELSRVQNGFYLRNVKLSYVKDFHLTLKFLGDIDDRKRQEIDGALRNVIFSPFRLTLSDVSGFPTKQNLNAVMISHPLQVPLHLSCCFYFCHNYIIHNILTFSSL